jgi:hypothetical protein
VQQSDSLSKQERNSEWSAKSSEPILEKLKNYPCPMGGTMGEIFDATPEEHISRVFIEEKLFETWHHGRAVLIGDGKDL